MKRYQFRLDRLLSIRRYREVEWELKLSAITGECVQLQNEIAEMDVQRRTTLATRYVSGAIDMDYLMAAELYMRRIDDRTTSDSATLEQKERERNEVREGYLAASRDRKVLDRLKERRLAAYRREQSTAEIFEVDDMSGSSAAWKISHK